MYYGATTAEGGGEVDNQKRHRAEQRSLEGAALPPLPPPMYASGNGGCGIGWLRFQRWCLRILHTRDGAAAHAERCAARGGHLAALTTLEKHDFVYDMLSPERDGWVGAVHSQAGTRGGAARSLGTRSRDSLLDAERGWRWRGGAPWRWTHWAISEPLNLGRATHCAALRKREGSRKDFGWISDDCEALHEAVCERALEQPSYGADGSGFAHSATLVSK